MTCRAQALAVLLLVTVSSSSNQSLSLSLLSYHRISSSDVRLLVVSRFACIGVLRCAVLSMSALTILAFVLFV